MEEQNAHMALQSTALDASYEIVPFTPLPPAQHAHDVTTNNGDVNLAGRDVIVHKHTHMYATQNVDILAALRMVRNLRNIHQDVLSRATPGTGIWLLQTDKFLLWLDINGNLKILWGTGIPGAGKTIQTSIVINELESRAAAAGGSICVCYVYFRYSDAADVTIRSVLEILVKQTAERHPECASLAEEVYARHLLESTQTTEGELLQLLQRFVKGKSATFYILDALDEAPDKLQLELVNKLADLNVRLFITSRPLKGVERRVSGVHSFSIVARAEDVELHIRKGIERSLELQGLLENAEPSLREEMVSTIKKNCKGMFLHASLQLDALCECLSTREVRRTLKEFPSNIEGVYLQTWTRILKRSPNCISLARTVLVWVLNAARSMTLEELERAVATSSDTYKFEPDKVVPGMTLVTLCRGLVIFEEESRVVRLVHYTAKGTLQGLFHDTFPHPHSHLAMVCMTHLTECNFQNTTLRSIERFLTALQADPLLAYASDAWVVHARESLDVEDTRRRVAKFITESGAYPTITNPDEPESFDVLRPLHILAIHNLPTSLITHDNIGDPNVTTHIDQDSPLTLASWLGHKDIVKTILACAKIKVNLVENHGYSALMSASINGHDCIVTLLLAHPKVQVNLVNHDAWSALMLAAHNGHECIVTLLLAHSDTLVNLTDNVGWSALMLAANKGHECSVALLLARPEILVNQVDDEGFSALMRAADAGHEGTVTVLLGDPNIQVNLVDNRGWSALMLAANEGREGIVALLLAHPEIQVNLVDIEGWSALMKAAHHGHESIVKLLLARSEIEVNLTDDDGWPALIFAASEGHEGVVKLLLAYPEIQVNLLDNNGWSALILAAINGHEYIVKLLLGCPEIQVDLISDIGLSALMLAADSGHTDVVTRLLTVDGIEVDTILVGAAEHGHEAIVRLLLEVPHIDTAFKRTKDGHTALSIAMAKGQDDIVRLLEEFEFCRMGGGSWELVETHAPKPKKKGWKKVLRNPIRSVKSFALRQRN